MSKKDHIIETIMQIVHDELTARMVYERLRDEGVINIGYGDNDIDRVVEAFKESYGITRISRYDRYSASRLVKAHGVQSVVGVIKLMGQAQGDRYSPVLNNIQQLEDKWVSVINYLRNSHRSVTQTMDF